MDHVDMTSQLPPNPVASSDSSAVSPEPAILQIYNAVVQKVDPKSNSLGEPYYETSAEDIRVYLTGLLRDLVKSPRSQNYKFAAEVCEVKDNIDKLLTKEFRSAALYLSGRLLGCEFFVQNKMRGFTELREGSLLCTHFGLAGKEYIILVKVDHADFLNEVTLRKASGLPEKQRAQKCATFTVVDGELEPTVVISDSSSVITEYWWNAYLTLVALSSPERNTLAAFNAVEKLLKSKVQSKSPSDYWTLRNAVVSYFTTRPQCIFPDMIDEVIGGYVPDNDEIVIADLVEAAKKLPEKDKGFDTHFVIVPKIISAKIKKQIKLAENVDLRIMGKVTNFKELFDTGNDGRKYLKIYSDEGYDAFHKKESFDDSE
ncbi:nucleoid-associated protein [Stutzerimonas nitrititolerans]|uniref:nucleoid-associated protein n=1 Tax=Stutzerimonas nitrititolerans TaxID=2482751 RepID=UPI00289E197C|nr:nucleoid-associated protein [Stutzerimonas nitrititolerans]